MHDPKKLAIKIKNLREAKGISQEKLARLADVSTNTVMNLEAEKQTNPTIRTLSGIAHALEVRIEDLWE